MKSIIVGAGKYGEVYLSLLRNSGIDVIGFLDDDSTKIGTSILDVPVLGKTETMGEHGEDAIYCPVGCNAFRVKILEEARSIGLITPNYIDPNVKISPNVDIAQNGVYILGNTFIMPYVKIDSDVMISVSSNIIHHTKLGQGSFVSNGVNLGASIDVKPLSYIGMGATVMTGVKTLGTDCLIGAGAVVIRDVPDGAVVVGNPARVLKFKDGYGEPKR